MPAPVVGSQKAYRGPDGILVSLVRLEDDSYLVRVTGSTHPLDNKVIRCKFITVHSGAHAWVTPYYGLELHILKRLVHRRGSLDYLLSLPGEQFIQDMRVAFDEQVTAALVPTELARQHEVQMADGSLEALLRFDVEGYKKKQEEELRADVARADKACGTRLRMVVEWEAIPEETRRDLTIRDFCDNALGGVRRFCDLGTVRATLGKHLAEVRCRVEQGKEMKVRLEGQTLHFAVGRQVMNRGSTAIRLVAEAIKWPGGRNFAHMAYRERVHLCTDDKGNYVGWRPTRDPDRFEDDRRRLYFGSKEKLRKVPYDRHVGEGWFFDPRFESAWGALGGRRSRLEHHSTLNWGKGDEACTLYCGKRQTKLRRLTLEEANRVVEGATFEPPLARREPHGLARDRAGVYYYVDKAAGDGLKDYRLYRGPLGRMTLLQMLNIVSDTQGEVYSTKNGTLRLVLEKGSSYWVERGRKSVLVNVPIAKNLSLIYNELGVYLTQPLGTPCDLF